MIFLKTFSEVPWEEIAQRKPRYYSGLKLDYEGQKTILPKQFGTFIYLFLSIKEIWYRTSKRIISSYFIELINNFPKKLNYSLIKTLSCFYTNPYLEPVVDVSFNQGGRIHLSKKITKKNLLKSFF